MKKQSKIQYQGSNRHGQQLTNKDKSNITNTFNEKRLIFDGMTEDQLVEIQNTNSYENKKLYGATKLALQYALELKRITKQIKTTDDERESR